MTDMVPVYKVIFCLLLLLCSRNRTFYAEWVIIAKHQVNNLSGISLHNKLHLDDDDDDDDVQFVLDQYA